MYIEPSTLVPIFRATIITLRKEGRLKKMSHLAASQLCACHIEPSYAFGATYESDRTEKWTLLVELKEHVFSIGLANSYGSIYDAPLMARRKRSRSGRCSDRRHRTRTTHRSTSMLTRRTRYCDV